MVRFEAAVASCFCSMRRERGRLGERERRGGENVLAASAKEPNIKANPKRKEWTFSCSVFGDSRPSKCGFWILGFVLLVGPLCCFLGSSL